MIIAGLDIASKTGVCLGEPGKTPTFWTEDLGVRDSHEKRFSNALRLAQKLVSDHGVEYIGIEAPIIVPKRDKKSINELLMGLIACVRGWAYTKQIGCATFEIATIDKHFVGKRLTGRDTRKQTIQSRCRLLGWCPKTEDEADAGAVWDLACARNSQAYAQLSSPLFAGRG